LRVNDEQLQKVRGGHGLFAALDQSGGSTPKTLALYGIAQDSYSSDAEMFDLVHEMRTRIMRSPSFQGDRVIGAILFQDTIGRQVDGKWTADYLWDVKGIVPFLKIDKGLEAELNGVQVMNPIPDLGTVLDRATAEKIFGTKMRSFITLPDRVGITAIVSQQFGLAAQIAAAGLVPIMEPEIDIHSPGKAEAEALLKAAITEELGRLPGGRPVMLKLTLPDQDDFYAEFVADPKVLRVLALSGGFTREEANDRLARNHGVIASFSRALLEGLLVSQGAQEFDTALDASIGSIARASDT
jgi:fructose-bisphosphate aldolase, class I